MMGLANFQYTFINLLTPLDDLRSYFPEDVNPKPYAHNANKPNLLITFWLHMESILCMQEKFT